MKDKTAILLISQNLRNEKEIIELKRINGKPIMMHSITNLIKKGYSNFIIVLPRAKKYLIEKLYNDFFKSSKIAFRFIIKEDLNNYEIFQEIFANNSDNLLFYKANSLLNFDLLKNSNIDFIIKTLVQETKSSGRESIAAINISEWQKYKINITNYFKNNREPNDLLVELAKCYKGEKYNGIEELNEIIDEDGIVINNYLNYVKASREYFNSREFNKLQLMDNSIIEKKSLYKGISDEIYWYQEAEKNGINITPKLLKTSKDNLSYYIEFIDYPSLSETFVFEDIQENIWDFIFEELINRINNQLWVKKKTLNITSTSHSMYYNKTIKRLTKWNRQDLLESENYIVNGEKIKGFKYQWPKLEEKISNLVNNSNNYCSVIHGDLCFSNILLSTRSFSFKLIDPRGEFGRRSIYGDYRYDIAKLRQSYHGQYDYIIAGLYNVKEYSKGNFSIEIFDENFKGYKNFDKFLEKLNVDLKEIELIEALLFLSMIPLHYDDSDRQLAFFIKAIGIINKL
ncbi:hypothetical protein J7I81_16450 [Bacillus sp. ISL-32]|nr:hypothetical protein [Bacillus sp. ISL-32]